MVNEARCDEAGNPPIRLTAVMEAETGDADFAFAHAAAFGLRVLPAIRKAFPDFVKRKTFVVCRGTLLRATQYNERHLPVILLCLKEFLAKKRAGGRGASSSAAVENSDEESPPEATAAAGPLGACFGRQRRPAPPP